VLSGGGLAAASDDAQRLSGSSPADTAKASGNLTRTSGKAARPVNIKKVNVPSIVINERRTKASVGVNVEINDPSVTSFRARAKVKRNGKAIATVGFNADTAGTKTVDRYTFRRGDGRGEFKIGPFHVTGTRSSGGGFGYQDDTKGTFKARSAIDGKLKITARGNNKRAAAHAKIHGANGFKGYDGKGKLQFSPGGGWNTLKVLDFKNGDKIYKFTTSKFRTYRLKIDKTNKAHRRRHRRHHDLDRAGRQSHPYQVLLVRPHFLTVATPVSLRRTRRTWYGGGCRVCPGVGVRTGSVGQRDHCTLADLPCPPRGPGGLRSLRRPGRQASRRRHHAPLGRPASPRPRLGRGGARPPAGVPAHHARHLPRSRSDRHHRRAQRPPLRATRQ